MGLSRFLKDGFDDASFVPDPADAQEEEFVDFALELEANLEVNAENVPGDVPGEVRADANVPVGEVNHEITQGVVPEVVVPDQRAEVKRVAIPGDKRKCIAGIPLEGAPKRVRTNQDGVPSGKPAKAKKKSSKFSVKNFQLQDENVMVKEGEDDAAVGAEKEVLQVLSSEDTRSVNAPIKGMRDMEFEEELDGLFIPPFFLVQHGSLLEDDEDRMDYVRNIMVPKKLQVAEELSDQQFLDFANRSLIDQITAQVEYLRRFSLASEHRYRLLRENARLKRRVTAFEEDAEHIRRGEQFEDLQNQISAKDKEITDLQGERDGWKEKFEKEVVASEANAARLLVEENKVRELTGLVESLRIEGNTLREEVQSFSVQVGQALEEKRRLAEGVPGMIRKILKSDEFNKEMGAVQELALDAGGHRAMGRLRAKFGARLDVTRLEDYKPEAFAALIAAGDQLGERDFPFLSCLASSVDLPANEFLQLEPVTLPDDVA